MSLIVQKYGGTSVGSLDRIRRVAERVAQTGERITLTGHTDNISSEESNLALGLQRARSIEQILMKWGVEASQIEVDTKGESQPVDSNDSETGRQNNRRVEVRLIKQ